MNLAAQFTNNRLFLNAKAKEKKLEKKNISEFLINFLKFMKSKKKNLQINV
jgi:hypothetical protein